MSKMTKEEEMNWYEQSRKHWRSWGSWFSWGSPVGLGIFILILLLATGLVISISKINEITKSRNTFKAKVYFSFIFSLLTFSLIIFF